MDIDETDRRILSSLSKGSFTSLKKISRELRIPDSTLSYRLKRLEESGVIVGYYYLLDDKGWGSLPFSLLLEGRLLTQVEREQMLSFCRMHPAVNFVQITAGPWSAHAVIVVQSYQQARDVVEELKECFSGTVSAVRMMPQLQFYKCTYYPFGS